MNELIKTQKSIRILSLFYRMYRGGEGIDKAEEAKRFHVTERSIQRDIDDIRAFFDEEKVNGRESKVVKYDKRKNKYLVV